MRTEESSYRCMWSVTRRSEITKQGGSSAASEGYKRQLRTLNVTLEKVLPLKPLHEYGFKEEDIKSFPISVEANQQRLITNSYRPWSIELSERVYRECF